MCEALKSVKKIPCGETNLGGNLRLLVTTKESFTGPWETWDAATKRWTITGAPPLVAGAQFAEFVFAKDECEGKYEQQGSRESPFFKHTVNADHLGYSDIIYDTLMSFKGQEVIAILKHRSGKLLCQYGTYDEPLLAKISGQTGKKAGDKRQNTLALEGEGYEFPPIPIPATIVIPVLP